jgi:hypothetical protein
LSQNGSLRGSTRFGRVHPLRKKMERNITLLRFLR